MAKLDIGHKAPAFQLPSTSGQVVKLADLAGRKVVLYFYPRDATPGCTREACDFRDAHSAVLGSNAVVLGVSSDSLKSHDKFRAAQKLPFDLLSDEGSQVAKAYGAFGDKMMYGKKVTGTIRSTFVIDERGKIAALWSPVKVDGHADVVLAALQGKTQPSAPTSKSSPKKTTPAKTTTAKTTTAKTTTAKTTTAKTTTAKGATNSGVTQKPAAKKKARGTTR